MFWDQAPVMPPRWSGFAPGFHLRRGISNYHPEASRATPLKRGREEVAEYTVQAGYRPFNPAWPNLPAVPQHDRNKVMLVFDCNGTLTSLTEIRKSRGFGVRPGVRELNRLVTSERFNVALWTSAMKSNMEKMRRRIEDASHTTFACALDRSHCVPAPASVLRTKKYETVKPLHEYFGEGPGPGLSKVILIDDNADKVLESETANLLLVPAWREHRDDKVLDVLVEGLMALDCTRDVRPQIKPIQDAVWQYFRAAYPRRELSSAGGVEGDSECCTEAASDSAGSESSAQHRMSHHDGEQHRILKSREVQVVVPTSVEPTAKNTPSTSPTSTLEAASPTRPAVSVLEQTSGDAKQKHARNPNRPQ